MKLLIVTQKVDISDPILGFFHGWISAFAARNEKITVIAQAVGRQALPPSVTVLSLGKEQGRPKFLQIAYFWWYILRESGSYDRVFVHMTPIWVIIGWPMWFLLRKPIFLWYEIKRGSLKLKLALAMVKKVFAATEHGIPGTSKKLVVTGHGIDTEAFFPDRSKCEENLIVALGRVTPIKGYESIVRAFAELPAQYQLFIAGGTVTEDDKNELAKIQSLVSALSIGDRVRIEWVSPQHVPSLLQRANLMLHASGGGLDKAVLQSMACGCPVVSYSIAALQVLPQSCQANPKNLGAVAARILALSPMERQGLEAELRRRIERDHSLPHCIDQLVAAMQA